MTLERVPIDEGMEKFYEIFFEVDGINYNRYYESQHIQPMILFKPADAIDYWDEPQLCDFSNGPLSEEAWIKYGRVMTEHELKRWLEMNEKEVM